MQNENKHISIGQAAKILGVSVVTLRRWEKLGHLVSSFRTFGKHRRYDIYALYQRLNKNKRINICYARVSSHDQKKDIVTQSDFLLAHCKLNRIDDVELIKDLGSGLNFKKKGLKRLISLIINAKVDTVYLTHKDRLLRFGSELVINIAKEFGTKIEILNNKVQSFEEQLASDVLEIITVCSARLYGSRSHKNKAKPV
jgi:predicted site-specific integrase-resolvase